MNRPALLKNIHLDSYVALDFETTGLNAREERIIEVAAIHFVDGKPADSFVHLVNPQREIPYHITGITGISNEMVSEAPAEADLVEGLFEFIADHPLVAHNISFDYEFLSFLRERHHIPDSTHTLYDTLQLSRVFLFFQPTHNLSALCEFFGMSSVGAHRAEKDTENCGHVFQDLIWEAASYPLEVVSKLDAVMRSFNRPNKELYSSLAVELTKMGELKKGLVESQIDKPSPPNIYYHEGTQIIDDMTIQDVFADGGHLQQVMDQYEKRKSQVDYSHFVENTLVSTGGVGVAEAGTGLGKTLAYLFPALKSASQDRSHKPTVISCYTRHLQGQLFQKDLPLLAEALDVDVKAVVLKGRGNYLCRTRLGWLQGDPSRYLKKEEIESILPLLAWLKWTQTGDLEECSGFWNSPGSLRTLGLVQSEPGFCTSPLCKRQHGCFFGPIRNAVHQAQLLVINHALLLSEVQSAGFLPAYDKVVIDEGHNLVGTAYSQFTLTLDQHSIRYALDRMDPDRQGSIRWANQLKSLGQLNPELATLKSNLSSELLDARSAVKGFFTVISNHLRPNLNPDLGYSQKFIIENLVEEFGQFHEEVEQVSRAFRELISVLTRIKSILLEMDPEKKDYPELFQVMDRGIERATEGLTLFVMVTQNQKEEWVYWYAGSFRGRVSPQVEVSVKGAPVDVAEDLSEGFFKLVEACVLTSASFQVEESFDYFLHRAGLDRPGVEPVETEVFSSPFHYEEQVTYYQYGGADGSAAETISRLVYHCHKTFKKRTLVLFTSRKRLNETADLLRKLEGGRELPIFAQTSRSSHTGLIRGLRQTPDGILLGTDVMWEGLDLPGDLLEILVITKIPFDVPAEPLVKAYSQLLTSEGKNSFYQYSIPEAVIRFRQGFGRLIRTISDSGIFIMTDDRIVHKGYGSHFSDAIPVPIRVFTDPDEISM